MNDLTKFLYLLMGSTAVAIFGGIGIMVLFLIAFPLSSQIIESEDPMTKTGAFIGLVAVWVISMIITKLVLGRTRKRIFTDPEYEQVSKQYKHDRDEL